jgi:hypothetical protein
MTITSVRKQLDPHGQQHLITVQIKDQTLANILRIPSEARRSIQQRKAT